MGYVEVSLFGSFQRGIRIRCENPLREIWTRIEHIGTNELLAEQKPDDKEADWPQLCEFAAIRIRQAVEFRNTASGATELTGPVSSYYSMLNLARAIYAVKKEKVPQPKHGLVYKPADNLYDCSAKLASGTFSDVIEAIGSDCTEGTVSLGECIRHIVEMAEYNTFSTILRPSCTSPVFLQIWKGGKVEGEIEAATVTDILDNDKWKTVFPDLADMCAVEDGKLILRTNIEDKGEKTDFASDFCEKYFEIDLSIQQNARWHAVRKSEEVVSLPRAGYYLAAMFILSSICRYEPEKLGNIFQFGSEEGWLLRQYISSANRYFPQLMLAWVYGKPVMTGRN